MNEDTGEIKPIAEVPVEERGWIPFAEGEEVTIKGIVFRISRIKQLRREIHLAYVRKAAPGGG